MPLFERTLTFPRPVAEVFDFFLQPANLLRVSPPDLHLQLIDPPERLQLGSRITLKGRRWGIPQRITSEVVVFEAGALFVDEQRSGPFRKWIHTHRFTAVPEGTQVQDTIEFEAPGGLLGLVVTESFILKDLEKLFAYRAEKLREILGP
jgi:ligand-binding SRPBCC domain-containing protein